MDRQAVELVLPHRAPMLLVDAVTDVVDGVSAETQRRVSADEPWFAASGERVDGPYPLALVLESWAQSAGVLVTRENPNPDVLSGTVMLFGSASGVRFHRDVPVGGLMRHRVRLVRRLGDSVVASGESEVDGRLVMTVDQIIMMFQPASVLRPSAELEEANG